MMSMNKIGKSGQNPAGLWWQFRQSQAIADEIQSRNQ